MNLTDELLDVLRSSRNSDGGWPYYAGKSSRLEPTAWALLALQAAGDPVTLEPFASWPRRGGLFVDRTSDEINIGFNGLLAVVLSAFGAASNESTTALLTALTATKGGQLPVSTVNRQDNSLQGWSWTEGTFSWVEPTAYGLLGVKRLRSVQADAVGSNAVGPNFSSAIPGSAAGGRTEVRPYDRASPRTAGEGRTEVRPYDRASSRTTGDGRVEVRPYDAGLLRSAAARIDEAERMLFDRVCKGGGWNHGNSNMLGAELRPYVSTSALALLALADKPAHPAVAESVRYLQQNRTTERSAMALGLTRIALGAFQQETDDVAKALQAEWRKAQYLGNLHVTALALYALAAADSRFEEFQVA